MRRSETRRCGELVHIDVMKLARVPAGGGHKMRPGRHPEPPRAGQTHIHTAIDASSRLASSEFAGPETAHKCIALLTRAVTGFAAQGITIERVLGLRHSRTRPDRPATNGKVARFNRTLLDEWAYARLWTTDARRARTLDHWLHRSNHHRHHTAIGGPPASRITDLPSHNT